MRKFILNCLLFAFTFVVVFYFTGKNHTGPIHKSDYMSALIDKHALLDRTPSPRIILCGGSNLTFGIDSREIEKAMGIPVINLSLHAGLGLNFIVNEIKYAARPNDIVIVSIEYYMMVDGDYALQKEAANDFPLANRFIKKNPFLDMTEASRYAYENFHNDFNSSVSNLLAIVRGVKSTGRDTSKSSYKDTSVYSRSGFNSYGDLISHLDRPQPGVLNDKLKMTYAKYKGIDVLNSFSDYARSQNIKVIFLYPTYCESEYESNKTVIDAYAEDFKKDLKIPILNTPADFVYPDSLFYNTVYHLNKRGRELRTRKLIEILQANQKYL
jgi:hypothetical protein